jgi:glutathione S-transferase
MKLFFSANSPFVRKARVTAIEKGVIDQIELFVSDRAKRPTELAPYNPMLKVPTLIDDDGEPWFDSPVICEYLDTLSPAPVLFPKDGMARWTALRHQALADGGMDDAVRLVYEGQREPGNRSPYWLGRYRAAALGALDTLEAEAAGFKDDFHIGHIATGCLLGFLDRTKAVGDWRADRENLALWHEEFKQRPSMVETDYKS